ncbi:MAG: hypothetical protein H6623_08980 [Bdellovibrionaceae bacterium]|nr:hypothetical protein [Pseudobdellovibrionaceae bacterium]
MDINIKDCIAFLRALDPQATEFTFQTFYDAKRPREIDFLARGEFEKALRNYKLKKEDLQKKLGRPHQGYFHGKPEDHFHWFKKLQDCGAGIFVTINKTVIGERSAKSVIALRAAFIDNDDGKKLDLPLTPSIVVQSKRGEHFYFTLKEGEPVEIFSTLQVSLAQHFGTDSSVKDKSRVMRLPGTYHLKNPNEPFLVTLDQINKVQYTSWDIFSLIDVHPGGKK